MRYNVIVLLQLVYCNIENIHEYFEGNLLLLLFLFIKSSRHRLRNTKNRRKRPRKFRIRIFYKMEELCEDLHFRAKRFY